ncbi:hypothetical protein GPK29_09410 [Aeromonas hydrophila]|uniref:hypothetical protein n=1 Tax=Aeromonas hydrophila TaxID=644 RepID=UPI001C5B73ED|nr:hypothetical protein [Aeromonas hydrophila]MBW3795335.1 hypothetical protein [Aeromonas hydrophila]MBW3801273.1 hypothetical protein [Aeromonas hydrophila]MBW3817365.1 hypothetical protein [Aeromonas hydrophila]
MNVTLNSISLPDDLVWRDEFDWSPVEQVVTPTLSGALLVEETPRPEGRPITLVGHCARATVQSLKALEAVPGQLLALTLLDGIARTVIWRRPGVVVTPLIEMADPEAGEPYALTLNFTEVSP